MELVKKQDHDFQSEYVALTHLSDRIAATNQDYRTDPAQVFIAAWCMVFTYNLGCDIAPLAAGKTFAFLLFAARVLELENAENHRVVIYVSSAIVAS